jgi:hypothetical protein
MEKKTPSESASTSSAPPNIVTVAKAACSSIMEKKTPSESASTSSAPPNIVTAAKASSSRNHCICGNSECETFRERALNEAPENHPWRKNYGLYEIQDNGNRRSEKNEALRRSCVRHLKLQPSALNISRMRVALIHWPPSSFELAKGRSMPLSLEEAKLEDEKATYMHHRFSDGMNKVGKLLEKNWAPPLKNADKYVQAPVHRSQDVKAYLDAFASTRSARVGARVSLSSSPVCLPAASTSVHVHTPALETSQVSASMEATPGKDVDMTDAMDVGSPEFFNFTLEYAIAYFSRKYRESHSDLQKFIECPLVPPMLTIALLHKNWTSFPLHDESKNGLPTFLFICPNLVKEPDCQKVNASVRNQERIFCSACCKKHHVQNQRESRKRRRQESGVDQADPSSRAPIAALDSEVLHERYRRVQVHGRTTKRRLQLTQYNHQRISSSRFITILPCRC